MYKSKVNSFKRYYFDFDIIIGIYKFIFRHSNLGKIFCKYRKFSIPGMVSVKINWEPLFAQTIRIRDAAANVCAAETAQIVITCLIDMVGNKMIQLEHYFYPHFRLREQRDKATSFASTIAASRKSLAVGGCGWFAWVREKCVG